MPNNPVQIVLNAQNYVQRSEVTGFGDSKDFYAGKDNEFRKHKQKLISNIESIKEKIIADKRPIKYAHVILQNAAWAKSHRPVKKIFPETKVQHVGGGAIGEMFVELTAENIDIIATSIIKAEEETNWQINKKGAKVAKPTRERSEVGGIKEIRLHGSEDRRGFSVDQAVSWLSDPRTGGSYIVQTFVNKRDASKRKNKYQIDLVLNEIDSFISSLNKLNLPISIEETNEKWTTTSFYLVKPNLDYSSMERDKAIEIHQILMNFLESEPLVRRISLPPIIHKSNAHYNGSTETAEIHKPNQKMEYPIVGIVDTGIINNGSLNSWIVGRSDFLGKISQDLSHGTFIGGLVTTAHTLNTSSYLQESSCKIFDLGLYAVNHEEFCDYYPRGFIDFLEQLDAELHNAKAHGVRVYNMSLSVEQLVKDDSYSYFAALIDEISDRHDVIFVLPAGNLDPSLARNPWPQNPTQAVQMLADYRYLGKDRILQPADSVRSVVVGALELPTDNENLVPAQYTRRGPSVALGVKPDVAHIGGRLSNNSGLFSIDLAGNIVESCGTSYAAPLAAKTLATLNHIIEGEVQRETLIGLLVHGSEVPDSLAHSSLTQIAKDFVGHGIPQNASTLLQTDDHAITLVFSGTMIGQHELVFPFSWPSSLVEQDGKCRGRAKMTLIYTPFTAMNFDAEYIRVNIDAYLRQEKIDKKTGEASYVGFFKPASNSAYEKERIEHGQKWWPVKSWDRTSNKGIGNSSQWRLVVDALTRTGGIIPEEGIPFSVILTIEDAEKNAPVFSEVRRTLQSSGVTISDVRTAQRIQPRV